MPSLTPLLRAAAALCLLGAGLQAHAQSAPGGPNPPFSDNRARFTQQGGQQLYQSICQACHMPQGQGATGAGFYPALAQNPRLATPSYPAFVVLHGLHGMPGFAQRLDDQQIADVVNYVRSNLGNQHSDAISPAQVAELRQAKPQ